MHHTSTEPYTNKLLSLSCVLGLQALLPSRSWEVFLCFWVVLTQGKKFLCYRNALGLSTGSWPKDMSFPGCHLVVRMWSWELLYSRQSCPGCPGSLANSDSAQKCSHVRTLCVLPAHALRGHPPALWAAHNSLAFSFRQYCLMVRLTFCSNGRRVWANAWAFEHSNAAWDTWLLSSVCPQFQGCVCKSFESYNTTF